MNKAVTVLLAAVVTLMLSACGITTSGEHQFLGTWAAVSVEKDGSVFTIDELEAMGDNSISDFSIVVKEGGKAYVSAEGQSAMVDWSTKDGGITLGVQDCTFNDGKLCVENNGVKIYLEKVSDSQVITSASENTDETSTSPAPTDDLGGVEGSENDTDLTQDGEANVDFSPQDVSDETIKSIETYNDYLAMFQKIVDDYLTNYEDAIKGTILYDEATFANMKIQYADAVEQQKEIYGILGNAPIIGKDELVEYLIDFRDNLKESTDTLKQSMSGLY
ncbi:MAG: hypothetical protein LBM18_00030 [Oscillospiraceae bacterium]|jgi:hypothetical protein|nr:hypothetical protein [Oscillospiraceae bacterium]